MSQDWTFEGFHHVQLAMPAGGESAASAFYALLGLEPLPKPRHLRARGGCWFRGGSVELHMGVDDGFVASSGKGHAALRVRGLDALRHRLQSSDIAIEDDAQLEGHERWYVRDPFGNRLELIEEG